MNLQDFLNLHISTQSCILADLNCPTYLFKDIVDNNYYNLFVPIVRNISTSQEIITIIVDKFEEYSLDKRNLVYHLTLNNNCNAESIIKLYNFLYLLPDEDITYGLYLGFLGNKNTPGNILDEIYDKFAHIADTFGFGTRSVKELINHKNTLTQTLEKMINNPKILNSVKDTIYVELGKRKNMSAFI